MIFHTKYPKVYSEHFFLLYTNACAETKEEEEGGTRTELRVLCTEIRQLGPRTTRTWTSRTTLTEPYDNSDRIERLIFYAAYYVHIESRGGSSHTQYGQTCDDCTVLEEEELSWYCLFVCLMVFNAIFTEHWIFQLFRGGVMIWGYFILHSNIKDLLTNTN